MKIWLISSIFPPRIGGPATQTLHLAEELQKRRHEVTVFTFGLSGNLRFPFRVIHFREFERLGPLGKLLKHANAFRKLWVMISKEKPDVIQYQSGVDYLCCVVALLLTFRRIPSLVKFAGELIWERMASKNGSLKNPLWLKQLYEFHKDTGIMTSRGGMWCYFLRKLEQWALNQYDIVWATSNFRQQTLLAHMRINPEKIRVLPNYIRLPNNGESDRDCKPTRPLYLIYVGRYASHKRLDWTFELFSRIKKKNRNVRLRLVGGGSAEEEHEVSDLLEKMKLTSSVDRLGVIPYDAMIENLMQSHVFLSASMEEGFGITFVESMACRTPVVCMNVGGAPEVVPHGLGGFVVEPEDMEDLERKVERLIVDRELRARMGSFGREYAKRFDIALNIGSFLSIYDELRRSHTGNEGVGRE